MVYLSGYDVVTCIPEAHGIGIGTASSTPIHSSRLRIVEVG
jgi:hypothetical protein